MRKLRLEELGRLDVNSYKRAEKIPIVVVLDNIRSAMNVGAFFRTCDAFKIQQIILCGITATPPHREILKTAIGATESMEWIFEKNIETAISQLEKDHFKIIGIEQTNESVHLNDFTVVTKEKYALIFGNEVQGISASILPSLDQAIEIPQYGTKHSLNVSVCGGIVIWHFVQPYIAASIIDQ